MDSLKHITGMQANKVSRIQRQDHLDKYYQHHHDMLTLLTLTNKRSHSCSGGWIGLGSGHWTI